MKISLELTCRASFPPRNFLGAGDEVPSAVDTGCHGYAATTLNTVALTGHELNGFEDA